ncbi:hypothetical protein H4R26_004872 [Coemansia thaxteri]|uniref:Uncharacterized protein n=1 Tax=Coemansia thaxteri TaxID=2663907 RepID=A0A9W8EGC6_9FUNG|nr:hypothetical protein H4R26_004872 [Coemansia thaxteri]KAJ2476815.1 hypothetical protein EV174_004809 [Coemansia sp. RSA 2320]
MSDSTLSQGALSSIPNYWPSKAAAYGVAGVYYAFGLALLVEGKRFHGEKRLVYLAVLISWMLGGAFTARGVFAGQGSWDNIAPYVAFGVLGGVAPNFINLVNYLLLILLMRDLYEGPSRRVVVGLRVFSVITALAFGALSAAGSGMISGTATADQLKTASTLLKVSTAGQMANSLLLLVFTSALVVGCSEALQRRGWVFIIYVGGLLIAARNVVRIVTVFHPENGLIRDSETRYYCLDPLFTLVIIFTWVVLNMPGRCQGRNREMLLDGAISK